MIFVLCSIIALNFFQSVDREVDLISPLVTPLTYEGLVDITLGIEYGRLRIESNLLGSEEATDLGGAKQPISNSSGGTNPSILAFSNVRTVLSCNPE